MEPNTKTSLHQWSQQFRRNRDQWRKIAKKSSQNHRVQGDVDVEMRWCCRCRASEALCMMSTAVNKAHSIPGKAESQVSFGVRCCCPLAVVLRDSLLSQALRLHHFLAKHAREGTPRSELSSFDLWLQGRRCTTTALMFHRDRIVNGIVAPGGLALRERHCRHLADSRCRWFDKVRGAVLSKTGQQLIGGKRKKPTDDFKQQGSHI